MYVCVCLAVTDTEVQKVIEDGATTRPAVTRACRAGGDCGACHGMIETMIEDCLDAGLVSNVRPAIACSAEQLVPEAALLRKLAA